MAVALSLGQGIMFCLHASFMPELFGTRVRYSGISMGFQIGAALSGGFTPVIAAALVALGGRNMAGFGLSDRPGGGQPGLGAADTGDLERRPDCGDRGVGYEFGETF